VDQQQPFADIAVVWAKAENTEGRIHGLVVERGMEGFTTPTTHGKLSFVPAPPASWCSTT
jgi:alkylation response protein AidB-like acyl-CoA dehydrogenase